MTYYWAGIVAAAHMAVTAAVLLAPALVPLDYVGYLAHAWPLVLADLYIRRLALRAYRHESVSASWRWRAWSLIYFSWPVYCTQWLRAVLRRRIVFRATPTGRSGLRLKTLSPQIGMALLLASAAGFGFSSVGVGALWAAMFAFVQVLPVALVLTLATGRSWGNASLPVGQVSERPAQGPS
jgi:hypothetical protein